MKEDNGPAHGCAASEKKSNAGTIGAGIIMIVALVAGGIAGYMLWQKNQVYVEGRSKL